MQLRNYFLLIATAVTCRAKVKLVQDNGIFIEFDKPLTITCTNDKTSDVEFRLEQHVVANCFGTLGCNVDDGRFNITQNMSAGRNEYILTSKNIIHTNLCGVYECYDLLHHEKDSAHVSIIGFDNDTYIATEEKDTVYLTTACTFHVTLSDMQIYWYTYDNTTLKLLDETRMESSMTPFNSESVCSYECGLLSAYRFTFGLNITDQEQGSTDVFIETKIFHPDYMNKPVIWRSSNTFRVKESSPKTPTSGLLMTVIVLVSVCVPGSIAGAIYALIRFQRKKMNRAETYISNNTETVINTANGEEECLLLSESSEGIKRGEKKLSDSVSTIDTCVRDQGKRSTNFKTRVDTAPLVNEELCWLLSDSSKRIKHRDEWKHSQSEGAIDASVRDKGKKKHQLRNRWKHSQTESPINVCIGVQGRKKHQLRDTGKHSQSESVIDACVRILRKKKHQLRNRWKHRHSEAAVYHSEEEIALIDDSETGQNSFKFGRTTLINPKSKRHKWYC